MNEQMIMITLDKIAEKFGVSVENLIGAVLETRIMLLGVLIVCLAVIFILMGVFVYFCKFKKISDKYEFEIFATSVIGIIIIIVCAVLSVSMLYETIYAYNFPDIWAIKTILNMLN